MWDVGNTRTGPDRTHEIRAPHIGHRSASPIGTGHSPDATSLLSALGQRPSPRLSAYTATSRSTLASLDSKLSTHKRRVQYGPNTFGVWGAPAAAYGPCSVSPSSEGRRAASSGLTRGGDNGSRRRGSAATRFASSPEPSLKTPLPVEERVDDPAVFSWPEGPIGGGVRSEAVAGGEAKEVEVGMWNCSGVERDEYGSGGAAPAGGAGVAPAGGGSTGS